MARGKQTCRILKEIRRQIAAANDIEYVTSECRYQGDCAGTCPKCEAEVRYLEEQLRQRQRSGRSIAIAGISAGIITLSGCSGTGNSTNPGPDVTLSGELHMQTDEQTKPEQADFEGEVDLDFLDDMTKTGDVIPEEVDDTMIIKTGEVIDITALEEIDR